MNGNRMMKISDQKKVVSNIDKTKSINETLDHKLIFLYILFTLVEMVA